MPLQNGTAMLCLGRADVSLCPLPHLKSSSSPCWDWTASNHISALFLLVSGLATKQGQWWFPGWGVEVSRGTQNPGDNQQHDHAAIYKMLVPTACSLGKEEIEQLLLISQESSWPRRHKAAQQSPGSPTMGSIGKESNEKSGNLLSTVVFQVSETNTIAHCKLLIKITSLSLVQD